MRKQLIEYQEKAAEQAAEMQILKVESASLSNQNAKLRIDYDQLDFDWRQKYAQLERSNAGAQTKSRLTPQGKPVLQATARLPPKSVAFTAGDSNQNIFGKKNQNVQSDESELEKELRDSREKTQTDLGKKLDTKRVQDNPPRRKYPVRECRNRAGTYKE